MNIIAQYDSNVQNAPAGYKTAVNAAIAFIDRMILDPITVTLTFSFGAIQGQALDSNALGESSTNGYIESYGVLASQLAASARSAADIASVNSLPTADPVNGDSFWVSDSQAKVFGVGSDPHFTDPQDGFVALSSSYNFTYDPTHRAVAGAFDAIGVLEHEITEALGRISYLGQATFQHQPLYAPYDLFRNSGEGARSLSLGAGYFSVDGTHVLLPLNDPRTGSDGGDWAPSAVGDAFGEAYSGRALLFSPTDRLVMDVLGYHMADLPVRDFMNEGHSDFIIENASGAVVVGDVGAGGTASFTQVAALGPEWTFAGYGDFLSDGRSGFIMENTHGAVVAAEVVNGAAVYTQVASLGPEWSLVGAGDFLRAGGTQILMENTAGAVVVAQTGANAVIYNRVASLGPEWTFHGTGDFNGDGASDFLIENTTGAVVVGELDSSGHAAFSRIGGLAAEWKFVGVGDFFGDGKSDFLIENAQGAVVVGEVGTNGQATYTQVAALGREWTFEGAGDVLGKSHDQFLIENTAGAVVAGDIQNGQAHFTQIAALGSDWWFHV